MQAFQLLKLRGLISQFTPSIEEGLKVLGSDASVYLGIDPTGDGLLFDSKSPEEFLGNWSERHLPCKLIDHFISSA